MSKEQNKDLLMFLEPYGDQITEVVLWLRDFVWGKYPAANELIYDNYNALAFGWSVTDRQGHTFCSIAVGRTSKNIHFGFYWGSELEDPEHMLLGNSKQYRYILVKELKDFPSAYMEQLLTEAHANVMAKVKDLRQIKEGLTIVKSISPVKRERRKPLKKK